MGAERGHRARLSPEDVEPLRSCLESDDPEVRAAALAALVRLPLASGTWGALTPTLSRLLDRHGDDARLLTELARVPVGTVRGRLRALLDDGLRTRGGGTARGLEPGEGPTRELAHALAAVGDPSGAPLLVAALESDEDDARMRAAESIAGCGAGELASRAWDRARHDPVDDVPFFVALGVARTGPVGPLRDILSRMADGELDLRLTWGDPAVAAARLRSLPPLPEEAVELIRRTSADHDLSLLEALVPDGSDPGSAGPGGPEPAGTDVPGGRPARPPAPERAARAGERVAEVLTPDTLRSREERPRVEDVLRREFPHLEPADASAAVVRAFRVVEPSDQGLGNLVVQLVSDYGPRLEPDVAGLFAAYRRLVEAHATSQGSQAAWVASRAGIAAVIREVAGVLRDGSTDERVRAADFVRTASRYARLAYGPIFGGGAPPPDPPPPALVEMTDLGSARGRGRPGSGPPPQPAPPVSRSRGRPAGEEAAATRGEPEEAAEETAAATPDELDDVAEEASGAAPDELEEAAEDVYALLDCDEVVEAGVEFELVVGLAPRPSEGVMGGPLTPLRDRRNYFLTVHVVADGFSLRDGESWRQVLAVTDEQRFPRATLHLVPDAPEGSMEPRGIQATFTVEGEVAGVAFRALSVVADAAAAASAPSTGPAPGLDLTIPGSPVPPDLTAVLFRARDRHELLLTLVTPHDGVPLPDEELPVPIGDEPHVFAERLVRAMSALEGKKRMYRTLRGKGALLARMLPDAFWTALRAVHDVVGRSPSLLLISDDPYVPWELTEVDPPLEPGAAPFLSAQTVMGRWVLRDVSLPPPHELEVAGMAAVAGNYTELPRWENLEAAFEERERLRRDWGAEVVDGTFDAVIELLERESPPSIVHVALHGKHSPDSVDEGLVLVDGEWLSPDVVLGTELRGHPFVFLNACQVGSGSEVLSQYAGMAAAFLVQGASAVVAPLWNVKDEVARTVALSFYERALGRGEGAGEALRAERASFRETAGDPDEPGGSSTLMAYQFFGHPALRLRRTEGGPVPDSS